MTQLWSYIYTLAKTPDFVGIEQPSDGDLKGLRKFLTFLHAHGVDWTDPSAWPVDFVNGHWERQSPILFLLESFAPGRICSINIVPAICRGNSAHLTRCCNYNAPQLATGKNMPSLLFVLSLRRSLPRCHHCAHTLHAALARTSKAAWSVCHGSVVILAYVMQSCGC